MAAIVAIILAGWIWAYGSATQEERDEVRSRCDGVHVFVGVRASAGLQGDGWTRRATYVCFPGDFSQPRQYRVVSRSNHPVEISSGNVWWPYILLALLLASAAWKCSAWGRRAA